MTRKIHSLKVALPLLASLFDSHPASAVGHPYEFAVDARMANHGSDAVTKTYGYMTLVTDGNGNGTIDVMFSNGNSRHSALFNARVRFLDAAGAVIREEHFDHWLAAAEFDEVIARAGDRVDGALYWKAYALSKAGRVDASVETLDRLFRDHPGSRWVKDGKALQLELREHGPGSPGSDEEADLELKLIALHSLAATDPDRAIPILEQMLLEPGVGQSGELREQALFVLIQTGRPEAMEITAQIARDGSDPQLQRAALHHLGLFGSGESLGLLEQVYRDTPDEDVRREILQGFMLAGDEQRVLTAAQDDSSEALREEAIQLLGVMNATT